MLSKVAKVGRGRNERGILEAWEGGCRSLLGLLVPLSTLALDLFKVA